MPKARKASRKSSQNKRKAQVKGRKLKNPEAKQVRGGINFNDGGNKPF